MEIWIASAWSPEEAAGAFVTSPGGTARIGANTGGRPLKASGPSVIDGHGVGVDAGIPVGNGSGVEAVPHPRSPSMTANVAA